MTARRWDRLVHTGNVLIDLVLDVPRLPDRGGDVLANGGAQLTGGGFNVMAAAVRLGLPTAYAGAHGTGPRGDQARADLAAEGVDVLQAPDPDRDTGFDVCLVEGTGERTFVTSPGAEAHLRTEQLAAFAVSERDVVYVSGYSLAFRPNREALDVWSARLPPACAVLLDPGPLVAQLPASSLHPLLARADWVTCNAREAAALTGTDDPADAAEALRERAPNAAVLVRADRSGCLLALPDEAPRWIAAYPVDAVDSTGAGDAHTGALLAGLASGASPSDAVRLANGAAALAVTRRGPATGPTRAELDRFLRRTLAGQGHDQAANPATE